MKRLAWLLLLPLASGALFAQYTINPATLPNGTVGVSYSASLTVNPVTLATWSISAGSFPPGLTPPSGSSMAGMIGGTPTTAGSYSFTVKAIIPSANAPIVVTQAYTVVIAGGQVAPVYISPSSLPGGTYGSAYSQVLTASGGYGPGTYTFSLDPATPGSLPPGLGILTTGPSTGEISGTPDRKSVV